MKRRRQQILCLCLTATLMLGSMGACGKKKSNVSQSDVQQTAAQTDDRAGAQEQVEKTPVAVPEISRIRQIGEYVVVECEYHNVAKSKKSPGIGPEHLGEKERIFWIEYTGTAKIYYRADKIRMEANGEEILVTLPRPSVSCSIKEDSWNEDSYVISPDQWLQKNPITAEDQTKAVALAQADMVGQIRSNSSLMSTAEMQIKELIGNYVDQIGAATGRTYHITWQTETK